MSRAKPNAFLPGPGIGPGSRRGLAGLLAPMRARLAATGAGFELALEPILLPELVHEWLDAHPSPATEAILIAGSGRAALAVEVPSLDEALAAAPWSTAVLIDGPIDAGDIRAVREAVESGRSPLAADLRATLAVRTIGDRAALVETREREGAAAIVAGRFPLYLAALTGAPAAAFTAPEAGLVERVLDRTGSLTVRPIETEVYSTSIDVGIGTHADGEPRPADTSLIYDRCSRTWHGE